MLRTITRYGPSRHRLIKTYSVVRADDPTSGCANDSEWRADLGTPDFPIACTWKVGEKCVQFDTGFVWLLRPSDRAALADALSASVRRASEAFAQVGLLIVPSGYDSDPRSRQPDYHFLEVHDNIEREITHNYIREWTPALIALSAVPVYGRSSGIGSARLATRRDQVAARFIASVSGRHLARVADELMREERVPNIASMDVDPMAQESSEAAPPLAIKTFDAQATIASALSQLLMVQALHLRAKRIHREGRRVGNLPQRQLDLDRGAAIAHGMSATFRAAVSGRPAVTSAAREVVRMAESHEKELRCLLASSTEIMPIVAGPSLNMVGARCARSESESIAIETRSTRGRAELVVTVAARLRRPEYHRDDSAAISVTRVSPGVADSLVSNWNTRLLLAQTARHSSPSDGPQQRFAPAAKPESRQGAVNSRDGRPDTFSRILVDRLTALGVNADSGEIDDVLVEYLKAGGAIDLTLPLKGLFRNQSARFPQWSRDLIR